MFAFAQPSLELYTKLGTRLPGRDSHSFSYAYQDRLREVSILPPRK